MIFIRLSSSAVFIQFLSIVFLLLEGLALFSFPSCLPFHHFGIISKNLFLTYIIYYNYRKFPNLLVDFLYILIGIYQTLPDIIQVNITILQISIFLFQLEILFSCWLPFFVVFNIFHNPYLFLIEWTMPYLKFYENPWFRHVSDTALVYFT